MEVFVNGQFLPTSQATISVQDRGLLYGDGLFETLRAEAGRPLWLGRHLARLRQSAAALNLTLPPAFPWEFKILELLQRNNLAQNLAAVKILVTRGEIAVLGLPPTDQPTIILYAREYEPPSNEEYRTGWPVLTFPEPRLNFLGRHKTLNYLFCLAARQYAVDRGGREGLILEADGTVSEGAATAVIWQEADTFFTPQARSALASVTVSVLQEALGHQGITLMAKSVTVDKLASAQAVWMANSLMGLLPISFLDGQSLTVSGETARLNNLLWSEAA
jgi:branched-chain amino acid aminotransferase/para-aminobenzoate synthetase component 1